MLVYILHVVFPSDSDCYIVLGVVNDLSMMIYVAYLGTVGRQLHIHSTA